MTYLAGETDPAKRRAAGQLRARALGYQYPSNVKQLMAVNDRQATIASHDYGWRAHTVLDEYLLLPTVK